LGNAQTIEGIPNLGRNVVPGLALLGDWLDIVVDIIKIDARQISAPGRHRTFLEELQALETKLPHPARFAFHLGDLLDDLLAQSFLGLKRIVLRYVEPRTIRPLFQLECLSTHDILHLLAHVAQYMSMGSNQFPLNPDLATRI